MPEMVLAWHRKPQHQRTHYAHEGHEGRNRISRQACESGGCSILSFNDAHSYGASRLDRSTPERKRADIFNRVFHVIRFTRGNAACGYNRSFELAALRNAALSFQARLSKYRDRLLRSRDA